MDVCFKFYKTLEAILDSGRQRWLVVDLHSVVHLYEYLEYLTFSDPICILCGPRRTILRELQQIPINCGELNIFWKFPYYEYYG